MSADLKKKTRIEFLNQFRGIAILAVVAIHSFPPNPGWRIGSAFSVQEISRNISTINNAIYDYFNFAVPAFIFISGFVLSYNYPNNSFNSFKFIRHRLFSVLPGYIFFSLVAILGLGIFNGWPPVSTIIFKLLTASASDPLWYIAAIIQLYLFYPLIIRIYNYCEEKRYLITLFIICLLIRVAWRYFTPFFNNIFQDELSVLTSRIFIPQLILFISGIYASRHYLKILGLVKKRMAWLILFLGAGIIIFLQFDINYPGYRLIDHSLYTIFCLAMIALSFIFAKYLSNQMHIPSKSVYSLGKYSFGIYLIHPVIMYVLCFIFLSVNLSFNSWMTYFILFILTAIFSYLGTVFISFLPFGNYLVGVRNRIKSFSVIPRGYQEKLPVAKSEFQEQIKDSSG